VESSCELGNEPSGSIQFWDLLSGCTDFSLWYGTQLHRVSWLVSYTRKEYLATANDLFMSRVWSFSIKLMKYICLMIEIYCWHILLTCIILT
jgi:hypothetical protein